MPDWDRRSLAERELDRRQKRPTEDEVHAEFKRRKGIADLDEDLIVRIFRRRLRITWSLLAFAIAFLAVVAILERTGRLEAFWLLILFAAAVVVLIIWTLGFYRCPQCGEVPHTAWHWEGLGGSQEVDLNPMKCRWCGARLRKR